MGAERRDLELAREALYARLVRAFVDRDFVTIERAMREDVVLELPGTSSFSGRHVGWDAVDRYLVGMRQFMRSTGKPITFEHEDNMMVATYETMVHGPKHLIDDMELRVEITVDEEERISTVFIQPDDIGLFDHVITEVLRSAS